MDNENYDEFGNYIGPDLDSEEDSDLDDGNLGAGASSASRGVHRDDDDLGDDDDDDDDEGTGSRGGRGGSAGDNGAGPVDGAAAERRGRQHAAGAAGLNLLDEEEEADRRIAIMDGEEENEVAERSVVLAEDKKYYPSAEEVYGEGTEALVMDEDQQPIEEPLVAPKSKKRIEVGKRDGLESNAPIEFMLGLMGAPALIRNIAVIGHLHHGKTVFMDMLLEQTHNLSEYQTKDGSAARKELRFTDSRIDEQHRGISLKSSPLSLILESSSAKSYLVNFMDTPGHLNFGDEVTAALRLADGVLLLVDAAEGVMMGTEKVLRSAVKAVGGSAITLVITKMDRLVTELRLPPTDAYHKIKHTIEDLNTHLAAVDPTAPPFNPAYGNVAFSAATHGWSFTLRSVAALQLEIQSNGALSAEEIRSKALPMSRRLWGDWYFHKDTRLFKKSPPEGGGERSFVEFVLEPLYKLYTVILGEHPHIIFQTLSELGVTIKDSQLKLDVQPLLRLALSQVFGTATGITDMIVDKIPSAKDGTKLKVERTYSGPLTGPIAMSVSQCLSEGPFVAAVAKLYPRHDCSIFDCFARIISGTIRVGDRVRVLGEGYSPEDDEDMSIRPVTGLSILQARYRIPVNTASAGCWVLIEGIDASVSKTATVVPELPLPEESEDDIQIFSPLQFDTASTVKIAVEPLNPAELPKLVEALRKMNKSYPLAVTRVEESGEHTIYGTGELQLDSIMKDIRELYSDVEVKVADPVTAFRETVVETSSLKCFAETPNKRNKLVMISEPMERGLAEEVETGMLGIEMGQRRLGDELVSRYEWDLMAARNVWAFGPDKSGPNVLVDYTLPGEVDKGLLGAVQNSIVQGFQWGCREGPLCEEPVRNVKFKLLDATIADEPLARSGGQIIPTSRRVGYSAFLMSTPRLMEPVYAVEIQTPADCMAAIYTILSRRRGHVVADVPKAGTPIYLVKAYLPVMESFGFETDLRYHTQGQAFGVSVFDHWQVVPGDPLDRSVVLRPLEPQPVQHLAREFMVKTRRRKGMAEDVSINKFFDDPMLLHLANQDQDLASML